MVRSGALALVGGLALALRLAHQSDIAASPLGAVLIGDGAAYDAWARRISAGEWLGTETFYQSPLYPYFLAAVYTLTDGGVQAVRLTQAVLGSIACVCLGVAGRAWFGHRTGLMAAAALAIFPWAIFAEGLIQKSGLDAFLMTGMLACLGLFARSRRRRWLWGAGLMLAALALNRETARLAYPVIVIWLMRLDGPAPGRVRAGWIVTLTAAAALLTVPVGLRNWAVGGEFLVSTAQMGPNAFIGNHAGASGTYDPLVAGGGSVERERVDATRVAEALAGHALTPHEVSLFWLGEAFRFVREDPGAWMRLLVTKAGLTLTADELVDTESLAVYAEHSRVLGALTWFSFGWIVVVAGFGAVAARPSREVWVLHGLALAVVASLLAFYVVDRYRYPLVPVGLLLAFGGVSTAAAGALSRRRLTAALVTALLIAVGAAWPTTTAFRDPTLFNIAIGHVNAGEPARAVFWLEEEIRRHPDHVEAWLALGHAHAKLGEHRRATAVFQRAAQADPGDWRIHAALGVSVRHSESVHAAIPHLKEAARLRPEIPEVHLNLALALVDAGALDHAEGVIREALTVGHTHGPALRLLLAHILLQTGRREEGAQVLEAMLEPDATRTLTDDVRAEIARLLAAFKRR